MDPVTTSTTWLQQMQLTANPSPGCSTRPPSVLGLQFVSLSPSITNIHPHPSVSAVDAMCPWLETWLVRWSVSGWWCVAAWWTLYEISGCWAGRAQRRSDALRSHSHTHKHSQHLGLLMTYLRHTFGPFYTESYWKDILDEISISTSGTESHSSLLNLSSRCSASIVYWNIRA